MPPKSFRWLPSLLPFLSDGKVWFPRAFCLMPKIVRLIPSVLASLSDGKVGFPKALGWSPSDFKSLLLTFRSGQMTGCRVYFRRFGGDGDVGGWRFCLLD